MAGSYELADRAKIQVQVLGREVELRGQFADGVLEPHEGEANRLGLRIREGSGFHAANGLSLQQLADRFDQREHELADGPPYIVRIRVPARRGTQRAQALELGAQ